MKQDIKTMLIQYITENQSKFYRLAYSYTHEREAALDIVQNSIVKALEKYGTIRNKDAIKTWFYRVIVNESLRYLDKYGKETPFGPEEFPEQSKEAKEEDDYELYRKIDRLPQEQKTIIMLRFYEDFSLKEIAQITGLSLSTVKYRLYTGLNKLKIAIQEEVL